MISNTKIKSIVIRGCSSAFVVRLPIKIIALTLFALTAFTHYSYAIGVNTQPVNNAGGDTLKSGLVGWWTFDGVDLVSNVADKSGSGNTGYMQGFTSTSSATVAGKLGQGLRFDGVDDYVNLGNNSSLNNINIRTISFWLNQKSYTGADSVGQHYFNKGDKTFIASDPSNSRYIFGQNFSSAIGRWSIPMSTMGLNRWYHVVIVYNRSSSSNDPVWYINGVPQTVTEYVTPSGTAVDDSSDLLTLGKSLVYGRWIRAIVDDVRIYNRALSVSEIKQLYNQSSSKFNAPLPNAGGDTLKSGLVGWWTFDGADLVSNVADKSGSGNTGYMSGFTSTSSATVAGKLGQGLKFDGSNDYVNVSTSAGSVKTISYWIKSNNQANGGIELNSEQYITDNAVPEGLVDPTLYIDNTVTTLYGSEKLTNPGMEAPYSSGVATGWSVPYGGTPAQESSTVHGGSSSQKMTTSGGFLSVQQNLSLTNGVQYKGSGWIYISSGAARLSIQEIGGSWTTYGGTSGISTTGTWKYASFYTQANYTNPAFRSYDNNVTTTWYVDDLSVKQVLVRYPITDNKWHHVVVTTNTGVTASNIKIGKGGSSYLNGIIDDVRVYNRALSASEIKQLYNQSSSKFNAPLPNAGSDTLKSGLVGWWTFDGADIVSNVADKSGSGNTGYMSGFTSTSSATVAGKLGQGLRFDGSNDYIKSTNTVNVTKTTISAWIKISAIPAQNTMIAGFMNGIGSVTHDKNLYIDTSGKLRFYVYDNSTKTTSEPSVALPLNKWIHVVGSADGTNAYAYVNGAQVGSVAAGNTYASYNTANIFIQGETGAVSFGGGYGQVSVDDVRVYNRALSTSEIKQLYNLGR